MTDFSGELGEYRLFDTLDDFVNNKFTKRALLTVKKDIVIVPKLPRSPIVYLRVKRVGVKGDFLENDNGSILVAHDNSAHAEISAGLHQAVMFRKCGIYLKEQSLNIYADTDRFVVGYHWPHQLVFKHLQKNLKANRSLDVVYAGRARKSRDALVNSVVRSCKKLDLKYLVTQSKKQISATNTPEGLLPPKEYAKKLSIAKLAYSFLGTGYRCHREWEAMLSGALLLIDKRSVDCCSFRGIEPTEHFVVIDESDIKGQMQYWIENQEKRESIARKAFDASWKVWRNAQDHWQPIRQLAADRIRENKWA